MLNLYRELRWDVFASNFEHSLPAHPLLDKGYCSIGCAPCTVATGKVKMNAREYGLRTEMFRQEDITSIDLEFRLDPSE